VHLFFTQATFACEQSKVPGSQLDEHRMPSQLGANSLLIAFDAWQHVAATQSESTWHCDSFGVQAIAKRLIAISVISRILFFMCLGKIV
jgi:hypothetical protein